MTCKQLRLHMNLYMKKQPVFILRNYDFKLCRVWFEKYKSRISFVRNLKESINNLKESNIRVIKYSLVRLHKNDKNDKNDKSDKVFISTATINWSEERMSWNYATFPSLLSRMWKIHIEKMIEIKSLNFKIWENFSFILLSR